MLLTLDQHAQRIGAFQSIERRLESRQERADAVAQLAIDQMRDDLSICVAFKDPALSKISSAFSAREVLNDAVVHNRHPPRLLRVCVAFNRAPRGSPNGYGRSLRFPDNGSRRQNFFHRADLARSARRRSMLTVLNGGDAGRIVAAILQPFQAFDKARGRPALTPTMPMMPHMVRRLSWL